MTEIIQSILKWKYSTLRQTAMKNTGQSNPGLSDSFLWICKVVKTYVKLQMHNYSKTIVEKSQNIQFSVVNLMLFSIVNAANRIMILSRS